MIEWLHYVQVVETCIELIACFPMTFFFTSEQAMPWVPGDEPLPLPVAVCLILSAPDFVPAPQVALMYRRMRQR